MCVLHIAGKQHVSWNCWKNGQNVKESAAEIPREASSSWKRLMVDIMEFLVVLGDYWLEIRGGWSLVERMCFDARGVYGKGTWNLRWLKAGVFNLDVKANDHGFLTKCPLGSPTHQQGTGRRGIGCAGRFQLPQSVLIKMIGWAEVQVVWSWWFESQQTSGVEHIHNVIQLSLLSSFKAFLPLQSETSSYWKDWLS